MSIGQKHDVCSDLISIRDYIRWGASQFNAAGLFFGHGTDNAWDEALQLVLHALHLSLPLNPEVLDARLTLSERKDVITLLRRRMDDRI
ncbi:MAG TPA: 50S ribosomal protein L3 N(5)-glutamine methyltransferase, partial [Cellvibrio sp.]|nr:50S ribosomal protein L3 N(5)-glutamine methyltransferase [Cellvibrio sp.]